MNPAGMLGELCLTVISDHAGKSLQGCSDKALETVVKQLDKRCALSAGILRVVDERKWITCLDLKQTTLTNEGLRRISGK